MAKKSLLTLIYKSPKTQQDVEFLLRDLAGDFARGYDPLYDDLVQEGWLALALVPASYYNPRHGGGSKLTTLCHTIARNAMLKALGKAPIVKKSDTSSLDDPDFSSSVPASTTPQGPTPELHAERYLLLAQPDAQYKEAATAAHWATLPSEERTAVVLPLPCRGQYQYSSKVCQTCSDQCTATTTNQHTAVGLALLNFLQTRGTRGATTREMVRDMRRRFGKAVAIYRHIRKLKKNHFVEIRKLGVRRLVYLR